MFFAQTGEHADFLFEEEDSTDVHITVELAHFEWTKRMHNEFKKVSDEDLTKIWPVGMGLFSDSYEHEQSPHFEFSHSGDPHTHIPDTCSKGVHMKQQFTELSLVFRRPHEYQYNAPSDDDPCLGEVQL